jgi:hypothetical protein
MIGGGAVVTESVPKQSKNLTGDRGAESEEALNQIRDSLRGLQFGSVNIIVQDGVIIQIDRTEKKRLRGNRNSIT